MTSLKASELERVSGGGAMKLTAQEIQAMFKEGHFHDQLKLAEEAIERGWHIGRTAQVDAFKNTAHQPNAYTGFVAQVNR